VIFDAGREYFESHPEISGEQLYAHMVRLAADAGWTFGGSIAGHLVGQFPHERIAGDRIESYIARILAAGRLLDLAELGGQRGNGGVHGDPGGQRMGMGPVKLAQGDAVIGDPSVVLGGLKFARGLFQRWAVAGLSVDHLRSPSRGFRP